MDSDSEISPPPRNISITRRIQALQQESRSKLNQISPEYDDLDDEIALGMNYNKKEPMRKFQGLISTNQELLTAQLEKKAEMVIAKAFDSYMHKMSRGEMRTEYEPVFRDPRLKLSSGSSSFSRHQLLANTQLLPPIMKQKVQKMELYDDESEVVDAFSLAQEQPIIRSVGGSYRPKPYDRVVRQPQQQHHLLMAQQHKQQFGQKKVFHSVFNGARAVRNNREDEEWDWGSGPKKSQQMSRLSPQKIIKLSGSSSNQNNFNGSSKNGYNNFGNDKKGAVNFYTNYRRDEKKKFEREFVSKEDLDSELDDYIKSRPKAKLESGKLEELKVEREKRFGSTCAITTVIINKTKILETDVKMDTFEEKDDKIEAKTQSGTTFANLEPKKEERATTPVLDINFDESEDKTFAPSDDEDDPFLIK